MSDSQRIDISSAPPDAAPLVQMNLMRAEITELLATVKKLTLDNEAMIAKLLERDTPPVWRALKSCNRGPFTYECLRRWCICGLIKAEKRLGRWYVDVESLDRRLAQLAAI